MNLDISDFIMAEKTLKSITQHSLESKVEEVFVNDVNEQRSAPGVLQPKKSAAGSVIAGSLRPVVACLISGPLGSRVLARTASGQGCIAGLSEALTDRVHG